MQDAKCDGMCVITVVSGECCHSFCHQLQIGCDWVWWAETETWKVDEETARQATATGEEWQQPICCGCCWWTGCRCHEFCWLRVFTTILPGAEVCV